MSESKKKTINLTPLPFYLMYGLWDIIERSVLLHQVTFIIQYILFIPAKSGFKRGYNTYNAGQDKKWWFCTLKIITLICFSLVGDERFELI